MPAFGMASRERKATCHPDIQRVFDRVILVFDCHILEGHRTTQRQQELWFQGRDANGFIVDPKKIVTYKDGIIKRSNHQTYPSIAIDAAPWYPVAPHIRWDAASKNRWYFFAGFVLATATDMGIALKAGCDWNRNWETADETFVDLPHYELVL